MRGAFLVRGLSLSLLLATLLTLGWSQGTAFTYQGFLRVSGLPAYGNYDFIFSLWDSETGGNQLAQLTRQNLRVQAGFFSTTLDFGLVWNGQDRYLQIAVRPVGLSEYTVLSPRVKVNPTPYAVLASFASPIGSAGGDLSGSYPDPTVVGIQGRAVSSAQPGNGQVLKWNGSQWAPANDLDTTYSAGAGLSLSGTTFSIAPGGVNDSMLSATGVSAGTYGSSTQVPVITVNAQGRITGITTQSVSISGAAGGDLSGWYPSPTVARIQGRSVSSAYPSYGQVLKWDGSQWAPANDNAGGLTLPFSGSFSGTDKAFYISSPYAVAIYGDGAAGVYGIGTNIGVYGSAYLYGVLGASNNGHAVYSWGAFTATGTKAFNIDHPLDPENYFLNHFCTEAPEPLNAYSGIVELDENGEAWVQLPDYYAAINRDPRYTLTPIGAPMPNLHIAVEIQGNRFKIAGGAPGKRVSWRIEAVRNDPWVRTYGFQTVLPKAEHQRGKYLHPELYGKPKELTIPELLPPTLRQDLTKIEQ